MALRHRPRRQRRMRRPALRRSWDLCRRRLCPRYGILRRFLRHDACHKRASSQALLVGCAHGHLVRLSTKIIVTASGVSRRASAPGQPMIAVDLFFDTLDLEEQFACNDAILVPSTWVARTAGVLWNRASWSPSQVRRSNELLRSQSFERATERSRTPNAALGGVWFAFHTDANNPPQTYAEYLMVWECPRGDRHTYVWF